MYPRIYKLFVFFEKRIDNYFCKWYYKNRGNRIEKTGDFSDKIVAVMSCCLTAFFVPFFGKKVKKQ